MRLSPPGTSFAVELTEAMQIKCVAQGHNILVPGFQLSTSVSRKHFNHISNLLQVGIIILRHLNNNKILVNQYFDYAQHTFHMIDFIY